MANNPVNPDLSETSFAYYEDFLKGVLEEDFYVFFDNETKKSNFLRQIEFTNEVRNFDKNTPRSVIEKYLKTSPYTRFLLFFNNADFSPFRQVNNTPEKHLELQLYPKNIIDTFATHFNEKSAILQVIKNYPLPEKEFHELIAINPDVLKLLKNEYKNRFERNLMNNIVCYNNTLHLKNYAEELGFAILPFLPLSDDDIENFAINERAVARMYNNKSLTENQKQTLATYDVDKSISNSLTFNISEKLIDACIEEMDCIGKDKTEISDLDLELQDVIFSTDFSADKNGLFADKIYYKICDACEKKFPEFNIKQNGPMAPFFDTLFGLIASSTPSNEMLLDCLEKIVNIPYEEKIDTQLYRVGIEIIENLKGNIPVNIADVTGERVIKTLKKSKDVFDIVSRMDSDKRVLMFSKMLLSGKLTEISEDVLAELLKLREPRLTAGLLCSNIDFDFSKYKTFIMKAFNKVGMYAMDFETLQQKTDEILALRNFIHTSHHSCLSNPKIKTFLYNHCINNIMQTTHVFQKHDVMIKKNTLYTPFEYLCDKSEAESMISFLKAFKLKGGVKLSETSVAAIKHTIDNINTTADFVETQKDIFEIGATPTLISFRSLLKNPTSNYNVPYKTYPYSIKYNDLNPKNLEGYKRYVDVCDVEDLLEIQNNILDTYQKAFETSHPFIDNYAVQHAQQFIYSTIKNIIPLCEYIREKINELEHETDIAEKFKDSILEI